MHSFDHRYYPHIMDSIYDYAEMESRPALSQVCWQWRERFDAECFWLKSFKTCRESERQSHGGTHVHQRYSFRVPNGSVVSTRSRAWLRSCRVVDIAEYVNLNHNHGLFIDTLRVPYSRARPTLEVRRHGLVYTDSIRCRRLVFDNNVRFKPPQSVAKVVINYRDSNYADLRYRCFNKIQVLHVVFIAHALYRDPTATDALVASRVEVRGKGGTSTTC